nr:NfeD family protein [Corynebacterium lactis]
MIALLWLGAAVLLALGELIVADLSLLMLSGGALAAAGSSQLGAPLWLDVVVFTVVAVALVLTVRPMLRRRMAVGDRTSELESRPELLPGKSALVVEAVSSSAGLIKVGGEFWSARALVPGETFAPESSVTIVQISGNTAIVDKQL